MTRWGFVIDVSRCVGCYSCFIACKDEYWDNDYPPFTAAQPKHGQFWMNIIKNERGNYPCVKVAYMPVPCMQCEDAPCIEAARDGAVYRRPDGIVIIDPQKAVGQKQLLAPEACPYGVIFWNNEKNLPQKCSFCVHRLETGGLPRCVLACPSECLKFGDLDDPGSEVAGLLESSGARVYHPEWQLKTGVYYIDLYKMTKVFIAGTVVCGDTDECAHGITVTLISGSNSIETITNTYGDFEFDGLEAGNYSVKVESSGYSSRTIDVDLGTNVYLGEVVLLKS